jgi:hypothetical protein
MMMMMSIVQEELKIGSSAWVYQCTHAMEGEEDEEARLAWCGLNSIDRYQVDVSRWGEGSRDIYKRMRSSRSRIPERYLERTAGRGV